jgi:hypothetical protein
MLITFVGKYHVLAFIHIYFSPNSFQPKNILLTYGLPRYGFMYVGYLIPTTVLGGTGGIVSIDYFMRYFT